MSGSLGMVGKEAGEMNFYEQHKIIKKWQCCRSLTSLLPAAVLIWQMAKILMDVWMVHVRKKGASVTPSSCSLYLEEIFVRLPDFAACSPTRRIVSHLLTASCDGMLCACRVLTVDTSFRGSLLDHQLKKTHPHTFLQAQKQGQPSAAPSLPLLFWDGPRVSSQICFRYTSTG